MCACEVIVSSSLHGLIIADAYGIPTVWAKFGNDINGNDFKFYDYYWSLGMSDIKPLEIYKDLPAVKELYEKATIKDVAHLQKQLQYLENLKL